MRKFLAATAVSAVVVTGGGVAFAASQGIDRPSVSAAAEPTSSTVAGRSGTDRNARGPRGHVKDVLDELVKEGTITQAQADAILARLDAEAPERGPGMNMGRGPGGVLGDVLSTAAKAIGVTPDELGQALRNGQSMADVAKVHGVDPAKVVKALVDAANIRIDQAVTDGKLSADKAQKLRDRLSDMATKIVDQAGGRGFGHGPRGPHGPDGDEADGPQGEAPSTTAPSTTAPSTAVPPTTAPSTSAPSTTEGTTTTS